MNLSGTIGWTRPTAWRRPPVGTTVTTSTTAMRMTLRSAPPTSAQPRATVRPARITRTHAILLEESDLLSYEGGVCQAWQLMVDKFTEPVPKGPDSPWVRSV
jgi:hypothetical protein